MRQFNPRKQKMFKNYILAFGLLVSLASQAVANSNASDCKNNLTLCLKLKINSQPQFPLPRPSKEANRIGQGAVEGPTSCHISEVYNDLLSTCSCDKIQGWFRSPQTGKCILKSSKFRNKCLLGFQFNQGVCSPNPMTRISAYCQRRGGVWLDNSCQIGARLVRQQIEMPEPIKQLPNILVHLALR